MKEMGVGSGMGVGGGRYGGKNHYIPKALSMKKMHSLNKNVKKRCFYHI